MPKDKSKINIESSMKLAKKTAVEAGLFLLKEIHNHKNILTSEGKDIKLEVDEKSETLIKTMLIESSGIPVLGEEFGQTSEDLGDEYWVVDPLDGTVNYLKGIPICCVSIALMNNSKPVLGVIYDFINDELYSGSLEHSAELNGKPISVSNTTKIEEGVLTTGLPRKTDFSNKALIKMIEDMQKWKKVRMIGSAAMSACYVASAKVDLYKENSTFLWDIAAGAAIVEAAGGVAILSNLKNDYTIDAVLSNKFLFSITI